MEEPGVRVVELNGTRVATCRRVGEQPRGAALDRLIAWASERHLLAKAGAPRFFGFSDPLPCTTSTGQVPSGEDAAYGYEAWMTVGDDAAGDDTVQVQEVPGGLYAVTRATAREFASGAAWERFESHLDPWMEEKRYEYDDTRQWLEEHIPDPDRMAELPELGDVSRWIAHDLYIPIKPATEKETRRTKELKNLVALVASVAVFAFMVGAVAGLEARRGPDWQLELKDYVTQSALLSETITIVSVVDAGEPWNFGTGMGTARSDDWRWGSIIPSFPAQAVKCVLLERSRPLTGGGEASKRQVVFLAYHTDGLYQVGWLAYAGPQEPFTPELKANLAAVGCDLRLE